MELPHDIHVQICLHLDTDLETFIDALDVKLAPKDYLYLLSVKYPLFYRKNLNNYDVERIYKQLIYMDIHTQKLEAERLSKWGHLSHLHVDKSATCKYVFERGVLKGNICAKPSIFAGYCRACIGKSGPTEELAAIGYVDSYSQKLINANFNPYILSDIQYLTDEIHDLHTDDIIDLYEIQKYFLLEGIQLIRHYFIYKRDDLDTFIKAIKLLDKSENIIKIDSIISYNARNILKYILEHKLYKYDINDNILEGIIDGRIEIATLQLVFEYITLPKEQILDVVLAYDNLDKMITDYIISQITDNDIGLVFNRIISIMNDGPEKLYLTELLNRFVNKFTDEQIIELYNDLIICYSTIEDKDKLVFKMCQHSAVIKKYS